MIYDQNNHDLLLAFLLANVIKYSSIYDREQCFEKKKTKTKQKVKYVR